MRNGDRNFAFFLEMNRARRAVLASQKLITELIDSMDNYDTITTNSTVLILFD